MGPDKRTAEQMAIMCLGKRKYRSFHYANQIVEKRKQSGAGYLRVYSCPICYKFHITKKEDK